jgi:hypothetical protein
MIFTEQNYRRWLRLSIPGDLPHYIAGAVVPYLVAAGLSDWPKCFFGYYWIPPTEEVELDSSTPIEEWCHCR